MKYLPFLLFFTLFIQPGFGQEESSNKAMAQKYFEVVVNQQKLELLPEIFADSFLVHNLVAQENAYNTLPKLKEFLTYLFTAFPDLHYDIENLLVDRDKVVVTAKLNGTHRAEFLGYEASGNRVENLSEIFIFRFDAGKVVESWVQFDLYNLFHILQGEKGFLPEFLERWETSREYTLAVAEAMPEEAYHYKPTEEEMSFAEQLMHLAVVIDWHAFAKADGQEYRPRWDEFKAEERSKKEIMEIVSREFQRATELISGFDPERLVETGTYARFTRTRRQFFMLLADHVTHHRAQLLVYLRLKGITPPSYIDYQ